MAKPTTEMPAARRRWRGGLWAPFLLFAAIVASVAYLDAPPREADFVYVNTDEVFTLDPQRMSWMQDFRMAYAVYEGLLRSDNETMEPQTAGARHWERLSDGRTYVFQLRHDAKWSNGEPVTAHDYIYSWRRALLPETAADYSMMFYCISGGQAFFSWRTHQTQAYATDPWADGAEVNPALADAVVEIARELAADSNRPDSLAIPDDLNWARVKSQAEAIERTTDEAVSLRFWRDATEIRRLFTSVRSTEASREAMALWLWGQAERKFERAVGLIAEDDYTLRVELHQPTAYFTDLLAFPLFYPVHRPTVEGWRVDQETREAMRESGWRSVTPPPFADRRWVSLDAKTGYLQQQSGWTKPEFLVNNGPYILTQWRYKRGMMLERNPRYHTQDRIKADTIRFYSIEDPNTAVMAFESGEIDWLGDVTTDYRADMLAQRQAYEARYASEIKRMRAEGMSMNEALAALPEPEAGERRNIHAIGVFGTDFYSFNCRKTLASGAPNPFYDSRVRRAFALSVDKHAIVQAVTRLNEPVANTFVPVGSIPGYEHPTGLEYNIDRALAEFRAAGWEDRDGDGLVENERGEPFPIVDLLFSTDTSRYKNISLALKDMWERQLNVQISLRGKSSKFFKEDLKSGNFMVGRGRWYGDYGDPTTFLDLFRTDDGNNDRGYSNPQFDALLTRAANEADPALRMQMLSQAEHMLFGDDDPEMPLLLLCQLVQLYMYEPGEVTGLTHHPRLIQYLWQLEANH